MRRFTKEQLKWIEDNLDAGVFRNQKHFADVFNALFGTDVTQAAMAQMLSRRGWSVKTIHNTPQWTKEQDEWLVENYERFGGDFVKMAGVFNETFQTNKTNCNLQKHLTRKGMHHPLPKSVRSVQKREEHQGGTRAWNNGMFRKGQKSVRGELPIGTIRYNSDGRPFIKVMLCNGDGGKSKGQGHNYREPFWKPLAKKIWEDNYGDVPEGYEVCVLSGDPNDTDVLNMVLLDRRMKARMAKNKWWNIDNTEIKKTATAWCKLFYALQDKGAI